jgi:hypothetical protein
MRLARADQSARTFQRIFADSALDEHKIRS